MQFDCQIKLFSSLPTFYDSKECKNFLIFLYILRGLEFF
jgi:hypothetical protein